MHLSKTFRLITITSISALASANALAVDLIWSGDTTGEPTWNRPESMFAPSFFATAVPYSVQLFHVTVTGGYVAEQNSQHDGFLLIYEGSFNALSPLDGLKNGDDDFAGIFSILPGSGTGVDASRIAPGEGINFSGDYTYTAGVQYYAVTTGFANDDFGTFTAAVGDGPGDVIAGVVPEPASFLALGVGLLGLALARKRR